MSQKRSRAAYESNETGEPPAHAPYALYGTPLPPYDPEVRDDGSYVPIWKQEVTDERGRKRLHGAFTGGWSAGYFNTVGSKEGWTPRSFVSSRTNRAKANSDGGGGGGQKVEDFMDEEDLAQRAESQAIETQGAFAGLGSGGGSDDATRGIFGDLFRTTGETMGIKLLQRMGWRQGQGIGPRVKRRIKGDQKGDMHLFAPDDSPMVSFHRKTDRKGIGFDGGASINAEPRYALSGSDDDDERDARILHANRSKVLNASKKPKKKAASFGVGVLNDTGSDDEDAYDMGPKISYNRILGGDKAKKKPGLGMTTATKLVQKPVITSKKLAQRTSTLSGFRKCHDGRLPIDGFVLSLAPLSIVQENRHPPPTPPEGWKPTASTASSQDSTSSQSTVDAAKASTLNPTSRAALLGEQQLPGKSIFDFMSPAARERLAAATGKPNLPPARGEGAPAGFTAPDTHKSPWDLVPKLDQTAASAALQRCRGGWTPYAEDESKKVRYLSFLELKAGRATDLPGRPRTLSIDDWAKEMREFAQAAQVFKPISGLMASRFTSSSSTPRLASDAPDSVRSESAREEDPAEKAAKMGMYGTMTRSRQPFFPTRLLCKRFNVRPPANVAVDPGGAPDRDGETSVEETKRLDVVSQASLDQMMMHASSERSTVAGNNFISGFVEGGVDEIGGLRFHGTKHMPEVVDAERNEALEAPRAAEEVFKSVFGDDEESR